MNSIETIIDIIIIIIIIIIITTIIWTNLSICFHNIITAFYVAKRYEALQQSCNHSLCRIWNLESNQTQRSKFLWTVVRM